MAKAFPEARLPSRPGDVPLADEALLRLTLLERLPENRRESLLRYPGAMRLRWFESGAVICRQADEDCTAFFVLTPIDLCRVRAALEDGDLEFARVRAALEQLPAEQREQVEEAYRTSEELYRRRAEALREAEGLKAQAKQGSAEEKAKAAAGEKAARQTAERLWKEYQAATTRAAGQPNLFANVYLSLPRQQATRRGKRRRMTPQAPAYFPSDGPREMDYRTRQAAINDGEVFGEMACLNRQPRSATVVAQRGGLVLEMLSNILAVIDEDPGYKKERDENYRQRVLDLHLRDLSIFRALSNEEFARVFAAIRPKVELVSFASAQLICDEHERPDCMYLVREGIVQVKMGVGALLQESDVLDWAKLAEVPLVARLPLHNPLVGANNVPGLRREVVYALNDAIKDPKFAEAAELKELLNSAAFQARVAELPPGPQRTEIDQRRFHRLLLEAALPAGTLRSYRKPVGPERTVTYLSRGDFIGEMGLMSGQPRNATCIAFGQPRKSAAPEERSRLVFRHKQYQPTEIVWGLPEGADDAKAAARVELVRIPGDVFAQLVETFPNLRQRIAEVVKQREQQNRQLLERRPTGPARGLNSGEAARLGLVQGQQLMLIDLERCTRCDECVKACVDAHEDGNSRLFLFGPRFDRYLVPTTCRSCLDPVCMIGCPVRAIQRGANREMEITDWCIGCTKCAKQCPYDSIQMHDLAAAAQKESEPAANVVEVKTRAVVCDLCSSTALGTPACVYACPHDAAVRVDAPREL